MNKRIFILLLILASSMFLTACDPAFEQFSSEMIDKNLEVVEGLEEYGTPAIVVNDLRDYIIVDTSYLNKGILIVQDKDMNTGVYSVFKSGLLFPTEAELTCSFIYTYYLGGYIETTSKDQKKTLYDINGNVILSKGDYDYTYVTTSKVLKENEDKNTKSKPEYEYFETVEYRLKGSIETLQKKYKVDIINKTREEATNSTYTKYFPYKQDLKEYGLDGYYAIGIQPTLYIYNDKDELVNKITIVEGGDYGVGLDGKIIVQKTYLTDKESKDYDLIMRGEKYILVSKSIDLLTGKVKELELDYLIGEADPYMDKDGNAKYAVATIRKIIEKYPVDSQMNVLIDSNGKIVSELGGIYPKELIKLEDNFYYYPRGKYFFNEKLEPLFALKGEPYIYKEESKIIFNDNGKYGAIDYQGNVVIPFDYSLISPYFSNNKTYAVYNDMKKYIIDFNGYKSSLPDNSTMVLPGLIYTYTYDQVLSKGEGKFLSYDGAVLTSVNYIGYGSGAYFQSIDNTYESGKLAAFQTKPSIYKYIVAKTQIQ